MKVRMSLKSDVQQNLNGSTSSKRQYMIEKQKRNDKEISATKFKEDKPNRIQIYLSILVLLLIITNVANAHRGARNEVDQCRISVGPEIVHLTAYTPGISGGKGYCQIVPD